MNPLNPYCAVNFFTNGGLERTRNIPTIVLFKKPISKMCPCSLMIVVNCGQDDRFEI